MGEFSKAIVDEYRVAREKGDYAAQAGILISLLKAVVEGSEVARDTADAVIHVNTKK